MITGEITIQNMNKYFTVQSAKMLAMTRGFSMCIMRRSKEQEHVENNEGTASILFYDNKIKLDAGVYKIAMQNKQKQKNASGYAKLGVTDDMGNNTLMCYVLV